MVNRPSVPEIITVNSEDLQTQIRDLLPSQNGFGSELQATNVITPIIDLTRTAEGSGLPSELQNALAFGSQTAFTITNATATVVNSTGFYRIFGVSNVKATAGFNELNFFQLSDGLSTKTIWQHTLSVGGSNVYSNIEFDFVVFLSAGDSLSATATTTASLVGSHRQIATGDGTLVQPSGFPL